MPTIVRRRKNEAKQALAHATAADLGVPVFYGLRCARCKAGLYDTAGNPRWEIVGGLTFVCTNGCRGVR